MNPIRVIVIALVACVALLVSGEVNAQVRTPPVMTEGVKVDPVAERAARLAELDIWLRRLVGRFRITTLTLDEYEGWADCVGIGYGAGVHCVLSTQPFEQARRAAPTMVLYGLDPDAPGVRYLQVDNESIAEGDVGKLAGDRIVFNVQCPIIQPSASPGAPSTLISCRREVQIHAPSNGKFLQIEDRKIERVMVHGPISAGESRFRDRPPITQVLLLQRVPEGRADDRPEAAH